MNREEYQELIDLTPEQEGAFAALERAVKRCKKAGICFYQNLERLGALNGHNISHVAANVDPKTKNRNHEHPSCLQGLDFPDVETTCSFADDDHYVILKDDPTS
jgi:hypothetical protein